jgi:5-exo-hydroxycamphor dehydrogenase
MVSLVISLPLRRPTIKKGKIMKMQDDADTTTRQGRAVVLTKLNELQMLRLPVPTPVAGSIVARVEFGGVCGSDVHIARGEFPLPYEIVLGHEGVGVLEELGTGVVADHAGVPVAVGDRIYWCPIAPCHHCWHCVVEKDFSSCTNATWFGPIDQPTRGSYADYITLPPHAAFFRIPDDTPSEAVIAMGCALPAVLQGLERLGGIRPLQKVVVQGCGPIGIAAIMMAKLSGASSVIAIDGSSERLEYAKLFGANMTLELGKLSEEERKAAIHAETSGRGADVVIECSGHKDAFGEGLRLCARNGSYLMIGLWASQGEQPFDPSYIVQNNIRLVGTQYAQGKHYHDAMRIAALHHRTLPFAKLITHHCALEDAGDALKIVAAGKAGKVVMTP